MKSIRKVKKMTERILLAIVLIFIAIQTGINIWAIKRINNMKGELDDNRRTHNGNNTN
jgi:lysozyme family protein